MSEQASIRRYEEDDHAQVRALFIRVNRELAPDGLKSAFEDYIKSSLAEEIDRIPAYYREKEGSFWVATLEGSVVGMLGLERYGDNDLELRRMYVDPDLRRQGIAQHMLRFAEAQSKSDGAKCLYLSTSELQEAALAFYRNSGYQLMREETANAASNKTIGGGIRRFYFVKDLGETAEFTE